MTIKELKNLIANYPDNADVFIEHDVEYIEEHSVYGCDNTELVGAVCHSAPEQTPCVVIY